MKCLALAVVFCLAIPLFAQQAVPEINFQAQTDFFQLPPDLYFGEAVGEHFEMLPAFPFNSVPFFTVLCCSSLMLTGHQP
jgi:hypothetical protein